MGDIATIKADIISKVSTATGLSATAWAGEEKAFSSTHPAVYVQWVGSQVGYNQEIGAISYVMNTIFLLYVATEDTGSTDGDVAAAVLLEQCRTALNGKVIGGLAVANPHDGELPGGKTEALVGIHAGCYLYGQAWEIEQLVD